MVKKFLSYYAPYKVLFTVDFLSAVIVGLLELAFPVIVSTFIDELLPTGNWQWILIAALGLVLIYLFNTLMQFIVTYWGTCSGRISSGISGTIYTDISKNYHSAFLIILKPENC